MEEGGTMLAVRVKDEPEYVVDVCIKIEAEVDAETDLKPEADCAQPALACLKPKDEVSWTDNLYADHEVKHGLVLGPEVLQQICDKCPETPHSEVGVLTAQEEKPRCRNTSFGAFKYTNAMDTYMCDACGKLFQNKRILIRHIKAHLRKNPKMLPKNFNQKVYFCKICNKKFFQSGHYNRHLQTHTGEKQHVCNVCKKQFTRVESLRIHERIHTGQRPYSCQFCDKQFTQAHNLTRHIRTHTGEKPYVCDICSKRCSQSGDLKTHKRIHDASQLSCNLCNKTFKHKSSLTKHKRNHSRKNVREFKKSRAIS